MKLRLLILSGLLLGACAQPGAEATPPPSAVERGAVLFHNEGCATCHVHANSTFNSFTVAIGPDLTDYRGDPAFLRLWLADPAAVRSNTTMPDVGLREAEIEDLIAFLNQPPGAE